MRALAAALALLGWAFAVSGPALAADGTALPAEGAAFLPERFGSGEIVRATLEFPEAAAREPFRLDRSAGLPEFEDPELIEAELSRNARGWTLALRFVPWSPGPGRIPAMSLRGLSVPQVAYQAASRLGSGEREASAPRKQADPPGSALYLYGFAGIAIVLVLAAFATVAWLLPAARAAGERWKRAQAFRRLCQSLDFLADGAADAEPAAFYAALSRSLRNYLGERIEESAPALTARELAAMPSAAFPAPGLRDEAAGILSEAERARYGGHMPGAGAMAAAARRTRDLAMAAEEALDARL